MDNQEESVFVENAETDVPATSNKIENQLGDLDNSNEFNDKNSKINNMGENLDENNAETLEKCQKSQLRDVKAHSWLYKIYRGTITTIRVLTFFVHDYILFSSVLYLNFYNFVYQWLSLFSKQSLVHIIFTIFSSLSDFAFFVLFFSLSWYLIRDMFDGLVTDWKKIYEFPDIYSFFQADYYDIKEVNFFVYLFGNIKIHFKILVKRIILGDDIIQDSLSVILVLVISILCLLYSKFFAYISLGGIYMLILTVSLNLLNIFIKRYIYTNNSLDSCLGNEVENYEEEQSTFFKFFDGYFKKFNMLGNEDCFISNIYYKIIVSLFILMSQIYIIIIAGINIKYCQEVGKVGITFGILLRIVYFPKTIDMNIIDSLINYRRTWKVLNKSITWIFVLILYLLAIITCIIIFAFSNLYDYPFIDYLSFEDRSSIAFVKQEGKIFTDVQKSFCNVNSDETPFTTEDFSMLTTLPRLYGINSDGKCFIKPKFRGVFNSTMKYIFGEDYQLQGIRIYCWTKTHDPYLVITSKSLLESKMNMYRDSNITKINNDYSHFYENSEYFKDVSHLCDDGIANYECKELQNCINEQKGDYNSINCKGQWSFYTNSYWREFDESYDPNIKGLEQYQITITDDLIIQPDFYYSNKTENTFLSGTHYIVGSGVENSWGYGSFIENTIRVFLPGIFENFLPFYGIIEDLYHDSYTMISEITTKLMYVESLSTNEIQSFGELIKHFNISNSCIFMIGHSISASIIKEFSSVTNISGIAFEGSQTLGYAEYRLSSDFSTDQIGTHNIANLYSGSQIITGQDDSFPVNGELPQHFYNPNVYDTACLITVTCGKTEKYVPFCKQVLNQHGEDPIKNYDELINAYRDRYVF